MTKQRAVTLALKALIAAALPSAKVTGFDGDTTKPTRRDPGGNVIGHPGEPGDPEVDLSPLNYHYAHRFYLEVAEPEGAAPETLDEMLTAIGTAVRADRHLGGLCSWLEAVAPDRNDRSTEMIASTDWALVPIDAHYSTEDPLA